VYRLSLGLIILNIGLPLIRMHTFVITLWVCLLAALLLLPCLLLIILLPIMFLCLPCLIRLLYRCPLHPLLCWNTSILLRKVRLIAHAFDFPDSPIQCTVGGLLRKSSQHWLLMSLLRVCMNRRMPSVAYVWQSINRKTALTIYLK
jgi:hypothetical protein